jgi:cysteine-rich repeat protein
MRALIGGLFLLGAVGAATAAGACVGDCNGDGSVTVDELIVGVQIALGRADVQACAAVDADADGAVTIPELVTAVDDALDGCAGPTPTATPSPDCGDGVAAGGEECDDGNRTAGDGCSDACTLEPGGDPCAGVPAATGAALTTELVTDAVNLPVHISAPPLDPRRVFIVEQRGHIRLVKDDVLLDADFLDIEARVRCCGERGLLGLAFHPDYESNGRFFVDYVNKDANTVIARYQVSADPDRADPDSEQVVLTIRQLRFENHKGGQVAFGPDGYLYVGMGDGGGGGDPADSGQDDGSLLGKLLRIDVDVDTPPYYAIPPTNPVAEFGMPLGLVWAKGLRNPWRFSFDRATGDLYIGDVGQNRLEEIDVQPANSGGGENYGWDIFEAEACFEPDPAPTCPARDAFVFPVLSYGRDDGCSVTGGFVYRGCALPDLRGEYFYSDYCTSFLRTFRFDGSAAIQRRDRTAELRPAPPRTIDTIVSFGEDARGELYIADYDGEVYRIAPQLPSP